MFLGFRVYVSQDLGFKGYGFSVFRIQGLGFIPYILNPRIYGVIVSRPTLNSVQTR